MKRFLSFISFAVCISIAMLPDSSYAKKGERQKPAGDRRVSELLEQISELGKISNRYERDFLFGYSAMQVGKLKEADALISGAMPGVEVVKDYALYYRAVIANAEKRFSEAQKFIEELFEKHPSSVLYNQGRFEMAKARSGLGFYEEAVRILSEYKKRADSQGAREADLMILSVSIEMGDSSAPSLARNMILHSGGEVSLKEVLPYFDSIKKKFGVDISQWMDGPSIQYQIASSFGDMSQWDEAAVRLEKIISSKKLDEELNIKSKWLLARAYRWLHRYDESIALMNELISTKGALTYAPGLRSTLAMVYAKKDEYAKAIEIRYQLLEDAPPRSRMAFNIAFQIAYLLMDEGKYDEALSVWRKIINAHVGVKQKAMVEWNIAWCHYMLAQYDRALSDLDHLMGTVAKKAKIHDRVLYWKGRTLEKMGRTESSHASYQEVISKYPKGYYAFLAKKRLSGPAKGGFMGLSPLEKGKPHLSKWEPSDRDSFSCSDHLRKADFFARIGMNENVASELSAVDLKQCSDSMETVLWLARKNSAYNLAIRIAKSHFKSALDSPPNSSQLTRFIWETDYPRAYEKTLFSAASADGVDELLAWSIMKNESAFRPAVISPAGAVGLLQLMPSTANRMARSLGGDSVDRRDLAKPAVNIKLGVRYLSELGRLFPNNPVAVIASYNAGEEAVARWIKNGSANQDIEEWIEEIPYSETNLYVKKVMTSYWNYKALY
ncbi:MAG: DUF3808 domain-containing protein [Myxococcales bacterium]|nr:DUF3808 domain-containing protein [Myxococcales bacterium]